MISMTKIHVSVYFSDGANEDVRADYKKHDVKVLSASNEGNVDFLVYGYMNRGTYEGQMGVVFTTMMKTVIWFRKSFCTCFHWI